MSGRRHRLNNVATAGLFVLLWAVPAMGQTAREREVEDVFWQSVVCERAVEVEAYLKAYPDGVYVSEAWACLERLERGLGLTRAERIRVQEGLQAAGQEPGPADGLFGGPGGKTRGAIRAWQAGKGMLATGYVTREQAETLVAMGEAAEDTRRTVAAREEAARRCHPRSPSGAAGDGDISGGADVPGRLAVGGRGAGDGGGAGGKFPDGVAGGRRGTV